MITGWQEIQEVTGFCPRTIRKLAREEDFPLVMVCKRPVTSRSLIDRWLLKRLSDQPRSPRKNASSPEGDGSQPQKSGGLNP